MRYFLSLLCFLSIGALTAQTSYRSPVDFTIGLSGTFGEPRTNHFHTGIDIRTQQVTGKKIYAIDDGYVSRIGISPAGYGKAIYIDHPDGRTSVYAHLNGFNDKIAEYVKQEQYRQESFAVNLILDPDQFPVKKGDVIAFSGNTGSSGGPHLHFEIRDTETQEPLNPLTFGFKVEDKISPTLRELRIIPKSNETAINGSCKGLNIVLSGGDKIYYLTGGKDTIYISGEVVFGISAIDKSTGSTGGNGVYSIDLFIDGRVAFRQKMDRLNFNAGRCVNSVLDYGEFVNNKKRFQTTHKQPGNILQIYETVESDGIFSFSDGKVHEIKYEVKDIAGNKSVVAFYIKNDPSKASKCPEKIISGYEIAWDERFDFSGPGIRFYGDSHTFYDDFIFQHSIEKQRPGYALAPVHIVGDECIPMNSFATLSLKPDSAAIAHIDSSKLLVVQINKQGKAVPQSGYFEKNYVTTKINSLGKFTVAADTIAPAITAVNISEGKNISAQKSIKVKISDNLSGIHTYAGTLNGNWILMEFDAKTRSLEYTFDEKLTKGKNIFILDVADYAGNSSQLKMNLIY